VFNINQVSLLQAVAPDHALGRVNASVRLVERGASLIGLAVGGVLGGAIGLRATLVCAVVIGCLAPVVLARSPVAALRELASAEVSA
jgi:predicted MFS family arabinose efflux permease